MEASHAKPSTSSKVAMLTFTKGSLALIAEAKCEPYSSKYPIADATWHRIMSCDLVVWQILIPFFEMKNDLTAHCKVSQQLHS